jgi:hypothetical protein
LSNLAGSQSKRPSSGGSKFKAFFVSEEVPAYAYAPLLLS